MRWSWWFWRGCGEGVVVVRGADDDYCHQSREGQDVECTLYPAVGVEVGKVKLSEMNS